MREGAWLLLPGVNSDRWSHSIQKKQSIIGRASECPISIPHPTVSRRHAVIWSQAGTNYIRDLNSLNGTFVDGMRVTEAAVAPGSELRVGRVKLDIVSNLNFEHESSVFDFDADVSAGPLTVSAIPKAMAPGMTLTVGQRQVLKLLLTGLPEKLIASALSVSRETVHTHVKEIYRQMNVHSRPELMALFISKTFEWAPSSED